MHFALSEEQEQLQEAARGFLAELPGSLSMTEQADAYDAGAWERIVEEQGWPAILVPEEAGGWGFGMMEMAVVFEEAGRTLTPCPLFSTVAFGVNALLVNGDADQQEAWLGELAAGTTATLALDGDVTATEAGGSWTLNGTKVRVVDGDSADVIIVATAEGLFLVRGENVQRTKVEALDTSRPLATLVFEGVTAEAKLAGNDLDTVLRRAAVLLAAESVGASEACLNDAVEYAKVRKQYGKAIGSFQSIQHLLADVVLEVESARAATWYAAIAIDNGADDEVLAAHTAKARASEALFTAAGQCIQVAGGIGFTWEHIAHMYFKRARSSFALLGEPREHREAVAAAVLG